MWWWHWLRALLILSLESATFPSDMKHALVTPLLKKTGLDANNIQNYCPIPNLCFERHVAVDLRRYIDENKLLDLLQIAYHPHHSSETALVRIHDDTTQALDHWKGVLLVLLNLTARLDNVDHAMLLQQTHSIATRVPALAWLMSYLSNRTMAIKIADAISRQRQLCCGVPQGSVLRPLLFTIKCKPISAICAKYNVKYHLYANDTLSEESSDAQLTSNEWGQYRGSCFLCALL